MMGLTFYYFVYEVVFWGQILIFVNDAAKEFAEIFNLNIAITLEKICSLYYNQGNKRICFLEVTKNEN